MNGTFETTGGARIGWTNATWPLAKLSATPNSLRVVVRVLGDYRFTPDTVVAINRYTMIPIFGWGIQIQHCNPEYPERFIFWCLGSPDKLLAGIRDSGFQPQAPITAIPQRQGFAIRWQAIVVALAAWNSLFILGMLLQRRTAPSPGLFLLFALAILVATPIAMIRWPAFQRLVLKPGRRVGEIRPFLNLLILILGTMFLGFLLMMLLKQ